MTSERYLEQMKNIQKSLLDFLNNESDTEENFQNLKNIFDDQKIHNNEYELKSVLYLLIKIANNHFHYPNFYDKIDRILQIFSNDIKKHFSNWEIFHIFKSNRRILLYLIEQKIMILNEYIVRTITEGKYYMTKYHRYFAPEIKHFIDENGINLNISQNPETIENLPAKFYEMRKSGEHFSPICVIIRQDSLKEFIVHINKNNLQLNEPIKPSIFETNRFLIKMNKPKDKKNDDDNPLTFIQYAAFCGSIQIFNYLQNEGVKLTPSLWLYAIHGQNSEIIHILEENNINPADISFHECVNESIKSHHNDVVNYLLINHFQSKYSDLNLFNSAIVAAIEYYNFEFIQEKHIKKFFNILCKSDYYILVDAALKKHNININKIYVLKIIFFF